MDLLTLQSLLDDEEDNIQGLLHYVSLPHDLIDDNGVDDVELKSVCQELILETKGHKTDYALRENTSEIYGVKTALNISRTIKKMSKEKYRKESTLEAEYIDSDIEDDQIEMFLHSRKKKRLIQQANEKQKIVPHPLEAVIVKRMRDIYGDKTDEEFFNELRVCRKTFSYLIERIKTVNIFNHEYIGGTYPVMPTTALQIFLVYMSRRITFRAIGKLFQICESAAMSNFDKCTEALNKLDDTEIMWPSTLTELSTIEEDFKQIYGIPGVVGSIGGCCLEIRPRQEPPAGYRIAKKKSIMWLLGVSDSKKKFLYVQAGFPGTFGLQEAFESSSLGEMMNSEALSLFKNSNYHLVGTNEFSLNSHLLVPYSSPELTVEEEKFNDRIEKMYVITTAFTEFKSRFAILQDRLNAKLEKIPNIIKALCVVHNIALNDPHDRKFLQPFIASDLLHDYSKFRDNECLTTSFDALAIAKRDKIKLSLI